MCPLHAGTHHVQPRVAKGLSLRCSEMADTGVPLAKAEGGKERRVTLKNAAGLTLVGTFYDAGTLARRCSKPNQFLPSVFLLAHICCGRRMSSRRCGV